MWGLYGNCKLLQPSMFVEWFFGIPDFQIYFIALGVWRPKLLLCDSLSLHFESGFCNVNTSFMVFNVTYYLESHNTIIFFIVNVKLILFNVKLINILLLMYIFTEQRWWCCILSKQPFWLLLGENEIYSKKL